MALILAIETATEVCSVSLALNGLCLAENNINLGNVHASMLHVLVDKILKETEKTSKELDAVAISMGPGSYTGLRVGTSAAKGFCYALNIPLIAINSLTNLSSIALDQTELPKNTLLAPMLDARRLEVYAAVFTKQLEIVKKTHALILDSEVFSELIENHALAYFGNGSDKAKQFLVKHKNATHIPNIKLNAFGLCRIAEEKFNQKAFEDLISFEPFYLKDFIGTTPKKKF